MNGDISIRKATLSDAPNIAATERICIDCPWTESQIAEEISSGAIFLVAEAGGEFCGYVSGRAVDDECEISNIAVVEKHRRQGVATALLSELFTRLAMRDVCSVFLLVREGNEPATELYGGFGFLQVGRRTNYYKGSDALVMRKNLW